MLTYQELFNKIWGACTTALELVKEYTGVVTLNGAAGEIKTHKLKFTGYENTVFDLDASNTVKIPSGEGVDVPEAVSFGGESTGSWNGETLLNVNIPVPYHPVESLNGKKGAVTLAPADVGAAAKSAVPSKLKSPQSVTFKGAVNATYNGAGKLTVKIPEMPENVTSVNEQSGAVVIGAGDIGAAQPRQIPTELKSPAEITFSGADTGSYDGSATLDIRIPLPLTETVQSVNQKTGAVVLENTDVRAMSKAITEIKSPQKLRFTGLVSAQYDGSTEVVIDIPEEAIGVSSVNGYTGAVKLTASDVQATPETDTIVSPYALTWGGKNSGSYIGQASTFLDLSGGIEVAIVRDVQQPLGTSDNYASLFYTKVGDIVFLTLSDDEYMYNVNLPNTYKEPPHIFADTSKLTDCVQIGSLGAFSNTYRIEGEGAYGVVNNTMILLVTGDNPRVPIGHGGSDYSVHIYQGMVKMT